MNAIDKMKFLGSKIEREFREQLKISNRSLFRSEKSKPLLKLLTENFPEMKTAYVVGWIPEQGEDLFTILINDDIIAVVELDRVDSGVEPIIDRLSIEAYIHGLKKINRIKLAVAIDLARADME